MKFRFNEKQTDSNTLYQDNNHITKWPKLNDRLLKCDGGRAIEIEKYAETKMMLAHPIETVSQSVLARC